MVSTILFNVAILVSVLLLTAVRLVAHRVGHLVVGALCGFPVGAQDSRLAARRSGLPAALAEIPRAPFNALQFRHGFGLPPVDNDIAPLRWMAAVAAGPIAEVAAMLGVVGVLAFAGLRGPLLTAAVTEAVCLSVAALIEFVPYGAGEEMSEGRRLRLLGAGGATAERLRALIRLAALVQAGLRPREWESATVQRANSLEDGTCEERAACIYGYYHALDSANEARARQFLERDLAISAEPSSWQRPVLGLEHAYTAARDRLPEEQIDKFIYAAVGATRRSRYRYRVTARLRPYLPARVDAAAALARGDSEAARLEAMKGLRRMVATRAHSGPTAAQRAVCEREWLDQFVS